MALGAGVPTTVASTVGVDHLCLAPPADGPIVEPFRAPPCPYCAGHRGITIATEPGSQVRAAAAGTVVFSGAVAGERYVVVAHADGWRTTYGRLAVVIVGQGRTVGVGDTVGLAAGRLHFGLRRGDTYVDPEPFLGQVRRRARLVPVDGTPSRSAGSWPLGRCTLPDRGVPHGPGASSPALLRGVAARGPR